MMEKNMSAADRIIRFILVIAVIILLYVEVIKGPFATVIGIIGIIFVITSVIGWCPFYTILRIMKRKKKRSEE
jgi:hypothetical protein